MPNAKVLSEKQAIVAALTEKLLVKLCRPLLPVTGQTVADNAVHFFLCEGLAGLLGLLLGLALFGLGDLLGQLFHVHMLPSFSPEVRLSFSSSLA